MRLFALFDIYQILLFAFLISFCFLLNLTASGFWPSAFLFFPCLPTANPVLHRFCLPIPDPSRLLLLVFQRSKELTLVPGDDLPRVQKHDRPKNFSSSVTEFYNRVPVLFLQFLTFSSTGSQVFLLRALEMSFFPQFPPRFLICQFLFHILIWPWIHIPIV